MATKLCARTRRPSSNVRLGSGSGRLGAMWLNTSMTSVPRGPVAVERGLGDAGAGDDAVHGDGRRAAFEQELVAAPMTAVRVRSMRASMADLDRTGGRVSHTGGLLGETIRYRGVITGVSEVT